MRGAHRTRLIGIVALSAAGLTLACEARWVDVPGSDGAVKSSATVRARRVAYDGAPPVIPHTDFGADCSTCHDVQGIAVEGIGYAPASPHAGTERAGATIRCRQCHVFVADHDVFVENDFVGLSQDMRPGDRLSPMSPPRIPHRTLMRENCLACHSGPAAREDILTPHPELVRCRQCHVPVTTRSEFDSALGEGLLGGDTATTDPARR